jgi:Tfp pilus assembly protein PilP
MKTKFLLSLPLVLLCGQALGAPKNISIEEFLQNLSTVPDITSRRDPFVPPIAPFQLDIGARNKYPTPVLERYPVHEYSVIAALLGDQYPRALVKLPPSEKGRVLIVKKGDKLGADNGVIIKIQKDGLLVRQTQKSPLGVVDTNDIFLRIIAGGANGKN